MVDVTNFPSDFEARQLDIMQRRKRAQEGQTYEVPAGQMVSGHYVPTSWTQHLAEGLKGYGNILEERKTNQELKDLRTDRQTAMANVLRDFNTAINGSPAAPTGETFTMGANEMGDETTEQQRWKPAVKPNPSGAAMILASSPFAQHQGAGLQMLASQLKRREDSDYQQGQRDLWQKVGGDAQAFIMAGGSPDLAKSFAEAPSLGKTKGTAINGRLVNPITGEVIAEVAPQANMATDLLIPDGKGGFTVNQPLVNAKTGIAKAGASNVNVSTDKSYFGNVAEGLAKQDTGAIDAARGAPKAIETARSIQTLLSDPALITGTGANVRLALNKAFQTAGLIDGKTVANTEQLGSLLANQTLAAIKSSGLGAGNGFTNTDREFLEKAASGQITMDVNTLRRIAQTNERVGLAAIERGNAVIKGLKQSGKMGGVPLEEIAAPTVPGFRVVRD